MPENAWTTQGIADLVEGRLVGPADLPVHGVEQLALAGEGQLSFIGDEKFAERWSASQASAALVNRGLEVESRPGKALIFVENADLAMAKVLEAFAPALPRPDAGVHPTAAVHPTAQLGEGVRIGPHCVIGARVRIGDGAILHGGVHILDEAHVGRQCEIWPGVVIRERCILGDRCILHPNVVIGADGFGYRPGKTAQGPGLVKIPHIGIVRIGNDVEIGAGACVDRGKFSATFIDDGTKIDNMVQVAHNCRVGKHVVIAGCTALAGSVTIGDGAILGGLVAVKDHLKIGRGTKIGGGAQVMHDVPDGEAWAGSPAQPLKQAARQVLAMQKLPDLVKAFKRR